MDFKFDWYISNRLLNNIAIHYVIEFMTHEVSRRMPCQTYIRWLFRSSTDIKMRNCIHLTTQLHNNCTLNCMTCAPLRLGVQARLVSNASCYSYELTGKFRPFRDNHDRPLYGKQFSTWSSSVCHEQTATSLQWTAGYILKAIIQRPPVIGTYSCVEPSWCDRIYGNGLRSRRWVCNEWSRTVGAAEGIPVA